MSEVWVSIPEYEGRYEASSMGRIRTVPRLLVSQNLYGPYSKITKRSVLKQHTDHYGYRRVGLVDANGKRTNESVHRLIAKAFIHNPENFPQVNHKDCDKQNNKPENLEWCTNSQNHQHAVAHGKQTTCIYRCGRTGRVLSKSEWKKRQKAA